jgi:NADH:ubiquinone oxidoreductase subunit E
MEKFVSTPEQDKALESVINQYKEIPGTLITVLQQAQKIYGWLPLDVMKKIAEGLSLPLAQVAGVESFYTFFNNEPYGEHVIRMCKSAPCHIKGAAETLEAFKKELGIDVGGTTEDGKFTLLLCDCLGVCDRSPAVLIGDEVFGPITPADVPELIKKFN